jgi:hypothetical protein
MDPGVSNAAIRQRNKLLPFDQCQPEHNLPGWMRLGSADAKCVIHDGIPADIVIDPEAKRAAEEETRRRKEAMAAEKLRLHEEKRRARREATAARKAAEKAARSAYSAERKAAVAKGKPVKPQVAMQSLFGAKDPANVDRLERANPARKKALPKPKQVRPEGHLSMKEALEFLAGIGCKRTQQALSKAAARNRLVVRHVGKHIYITQEALRLYAADSPPSKLESLARARAARLAHLRELRNVAKASA